MKIKLTTAERILLGQILNIKLDKATLRDHIKLESIFRKIDIDSIKFPKPVDFAEEKDKELFKKYDGQVVSKIEDENHKKIISEAIMKAKQEELKIWANDEEPDFEIELTEDEQSTLLDFFDNDNRTWPREYHKAITSIYPKLKVVN